MLELSPGYRWWDVEPPEDEESLPFDEAAHDSVSAVERLDGASPHKLFDNVVVIEEADGVRFEAPRRLIETKNHGRWQLRVYGARRWFKEVDHYGEIRFTQSGEVLWIPHLYPFEELDGDNLPIIRDRERCALTVELSKYQGEMPEPDKSEVCIDTPKAGYVACESIESYNPNGLRYYDEFATESLRLIVRIVTYPERQWQMYADYADSHPDAPSLYDILNSGGSLTMPAEYTAQDLPNAWYDRERRELSPTGAFGRIYVPVDMLRHGALDDVMIRFPMFE